MFSFRNLYMLAVATLLIAGCSTFNGNPKGSAEMPDDSVRAAAVDEYRIGVDDQLEVNVWRDPELSVSMPVRPDGKITMPLIGDVKAGGRTPQEVAGDIKQRLKAYVRDPDVTVILTELRSHEYLSRVRVTGAVLDPVSMPFRQGMTVLDAVLEAGGLNEFAAPTQCRVFRRGEQGTEVYKVNLEAILTGGDLATNVYLRPGDIVSIPERLF